MKKITGKKIGMTQIFVENGEVIPVTVVNASSTLDEELKEGELVVITGISKAPKKSLKRETWVDCPDPSKPSKTINFPGKIFLIIIFN